MRRKQVWRYYCEFCKKSNCSASSMSKHERSCTANPNRICRMHEHCDKEQVPIAELMVPLQASRADRNWLAGREKLRELASGCPACMLAAIRQSGIEEDFYDPESDTLPPSFEFNFKEETKAFWERVNESIMESERHYG